MANKTKNKIGFKVDNKKSGVKAKSGRGTQKGKALGFKGGTQKNTQVWNKRKGWRSAVRLTEPKDTKRSDKLSLVFFDNKILNEIVADCLPRAGGSEFQIHYRALTIHIMKDDFEVILTIPTAYYNFDQKVSSGSIDWELDDRDREAEAVKAVSDINAADLMEKMPFFNALNSVGYTVKFKEGDFGSIHRHPGRFGFSSIDLTKDPESPGIIYRNKNAVEVPQTDSVMYIHDKKCEIYTTEARVVNTKGAEDGGVEGDYCQIPTISIIRPEASVDGIKEDPACAVLGDVENDIFSKFHFVGAFGAEIKKYPMLEVILEMLSELEYNVSTENVDANRIEQAFGYYSGGKSGKKYYGSHYGGSRYCNDLWDDGYDFWGDTYDIWDDDGLYGIGSKTDKGHNKLKGGPTSEHKELDADKESSIVNDLEIGKMIETVLEYHDIEVKKNEVVDIENILHAHFTQNEIIGILNYAIDSPMFGEAADSEARSFWSDW